MKHGMSKAKIIGASILGCVLTLQMGAFSVTLETLASGVTELPFGTFVATMQPIHLAIGLVEGLITAAVLVFVYEARPELLYANVQESGQKARFSFKKTIAILAVAAAFIGGALSLVASAYPDGLEWSIERLTGATEIEAAGSAYETAEAIQETTSLLPDYAFRNSDSLLGTTFSGIVGAAVVAGVCVAACCAFKFFKKKTGNNQAVK